MVPGSGPDGYSEGSPGQSHAEEGKLEPGVTPKLPKGGGHKGRS
jgi:hypothetical protein